jgi:hypothetical protein
METLMKKDRRFPLKGQLRRPAMLAPGAKRISRDRLLRSPFSGARMENVWSKRLK